MPVASPSISDRPASTGAYFKGINILASRRKRCGAPVRAHRLANVDFQHICFFLPMKQPKEKKVVSVCELLADRYHGLWEALVHLFLTASRLYVGLSYQLLTVVLDLV